MLSYSRRCEKNDIFAYVLLRTTMASGYLNIFSRLQSRSTSAFSQAWRTSNRQRSYGQLSLASKQRFATPLLRVAGLTSLGLGLLYNQRPILCERRPLIFMGDSLFSLSNFLTASRASSPQPVEAAPSSPVPGKELPPPVSSVSVYELSFGTVAGICAGVFIKKGLKIFAFVCGGLFVVLQASTTKK